MSIIFHPMYFRSLSHLNNFDTISSLWESWNRWRRPVKWTRKNLWHIHITSRMRNSTHFSLKLVSCGNLPLLSVIRVFSFSPNFSNSNRETCSCILRTSNACFPLECTLLSVEQCVFMVYFLIHSARGHSENSETGVHREKKYIKIFKRVKCSFVVLCTPPPPPHPKFP